MGRQTALVTGASRGIGRAIALRLARDGYDVAVHCRAQQEAAQAVAQEIRSLGQDALVLRADVADPAQVAEMVHRAEERFGGIDALVCNAGHALQKLLTDTTDEEWRRMFAVHVNGAFFCCRAVLPGMIRRQAGRIVTISSMWGVSGGSCEVAYSAAKAALIGMTRALAREVGPSHIRVNCVAPGVIDTDMNAGLCADTRRELADQTPLGRLGTPEEVAAAVAFLCSKDADFITGQVLLADGGITGSL